MLESFGSHEVSDLIFKMANLMLIFPVAAKCTSKDVTHPFDKYLHLK
jgi:hypothetical protein